MTLFEFVFGAVVFVRPYQEKNAYTYAITFIMVMFSFFGNIMLANMLVAFLTSGFESINKNAKYLTMNMQYGLIKVFAVHDTDTILCLPYPLVVPGLFFYAFMVNKGPQRKKVNLLLRKIIHIVNIFVPVLLWSIIKEITLFFYRYFEIALILLFGGLLRPIKLVYLLTWLLAGPVLLTKLFLQDIATICSILLKMSDSGEELVVFNIEDEARSNVVRIFKKVNRVIVHELHSKESVEITKVKFLELMGIINVQDHLLFSVMQGTMFAKEESVQKDVDMPMSNDKIFSMTLNEKYCLKDDKILAPILLSKFMSSPEAKLDLRFMKAKLSGMINVENIDKIVAFEKSTLEKASQYFLMDGSTEIIDEINDCNDQIVSVEGKVLNLVSSVSSLKALVSKLK